MTKEIQEFCRQIDNIWNTKGPVVVANSLFAYDAVFGPPNRALVKGKEALAMAWGDIFKQPTTHKCTVDEARSAGAGAWAYGEVTIIGNPANHVRWAAFDIRQNGQWKVQLLQVTPIPDKQ